MSDNGAGGPSIDLITVTRLWNFPQRIYALGKIRLAAIFGRGVSLRMLGYFLLTAGPIIAVLGLLNVPWEGLGITVRVVLPAVVVWVALRYAADGGAPLAFARDVTGLAVSVLAAAVARVAGRAPGGGRAVVVSSRARAVYGVQQPRLVGAAALVWASQVVLGGGVMQGRKQVGRGALVARSEESS